MASLKGLDTFLDVVDVLANPAKYEAKVEEIKKLTAGYTEAIEAVVKLADVNDYTQNIKKREEETKVILEQAKAEAKEIKARAQKYADDKFSEITTQQVLLAKEANDLLTREKALQVQLDLQSKEAAALLTWRAELEEQAAKLAEAEEVLAEKQAKLKAALA